MNYFSTLILGFLALTLSCPFNTSSDLSSDSPKLSDKPNPQYRRKCSVTEPNYEDQLNRPDSIESLNTWVIKTFGSVEVAKTPAREFADMYFHEADINGDGCQDAAILVKSINDVSASASGVKRISFADLEKNGKKGKGSFEKGSRLSLAVIFGVENGWFENNDQVQHSESTIFILEDAVTTTVINQKNSKSALIFLTVSPNSSRDYDDLIPFIPKTAKGACTVTYVSTKSTKQKFASVEHRLMTCFDGSDFTQEKLPNTKLYPY